MTAGMMAGMMVVSKAALTAEIMAGLMVSKQGEHWADLKVAD